MKKITLPSDIENHIHKNIAKRIICCALLLVLCAPVIAFLCTRLNAAEVVELKLRISFYIVIVALLPFIISGVPIKLIDSTWHGEIIKIDIKEQLAFNSVGGVKGIPYTKHSVYLLVKTDNGRIKKILAKEYGSKLNNGADVPSQGKIEHHTDDFSVGDTVYHFYGLKNYYVVRTHSDAIDCVICGSQNKSENKTCYYCGHTLIKVIK